jgi:four helix bundle protein
MKVHEPTTNYQADKDFTTLVAWQKVNNIKLFFYKKILSKLPKEEKYNLDIQIRKSAVSITANIAEGYGLFNYQENIQFYRIARGSLFELKDHLITCKDLEYIDQEIYDEGIHLIEDNKIALNGYIRYIKSKKRKNKHRLKLVITPLFPIFPLYPLFPLSSYIQYIPYYLITQLPCYLTTNFPRNTKSSSLSSFQ